MNVWYKAIAKLSDEPNDTLTCDHVHRTEDEVNQCVARIESLIDSGDFGLAIQGRYQAMIVNPN